MNGKKMKLKAISIKQPWIDLIINGKKTIETRKWKTSYRGPLLLVSSKKPQIGLAGYALGIADLINCKKMVKDDEIMSCCKLYPKANSWFLKNIKKIKPFKVNGKLGIYEIEVDKIEIIN
jgi:hypothetical protein